MAEIERTSSGILGLDKLIGGGFERNSAIALSGGCGTGKTIFALQFAAYGAQNNEPSVYVSFEESHDEILKDFASIGIDAKKLEEENRLKILSLDPIVTKAVEREISENIEKFGAKRVVIDSITAYSMSFAKDLEIKTEILKLIQKMKAKDVTLLLTNQTDGEKMSVSESIIEYIVDCVVKLSYEVFGTEFARTLVVKKMRRSNHSEEMNSVTITNQGIQIKKI
jgi:circadian clock protein KaiC